MARNISYYVKQNGKIIRSLLDNIDRLSKEIVDYAAEHSPPAHTGPVSIWEAPSGEDMVLCSAGPVKRIVTKYIDDDIHVVIEILRFGDNEMVTYDSLDRLARMEIALLLHQIIFGDPIIKKPQKV